MGTEIKEERGSARDIAKVGWLRCSEPKKRKERKEWKRGEKRHNTIHLSGGKARSQNTHPRDQQAHHQFSDLHISKRDKTYLIFITIIWLGSPKTRRYDFLLFLPDPGKQSSALWVGVVLALFFVSLSLVF